MAAHSNRPSSPISSRPTNPNSRSFSGNNSFAKPSTLSNPKRLDPMTPENSPSVFCQARSVGSGSCLKALPKPKIDNNQNPKTLPNPSKKVAFLDPQNANENSSDSDSLKISCSHVSYPVIAPLDADQSTCPYDPKTNYLSPRPQFLYYIPNPRLNIEKKEKLEAIASADTVIGFQHDFHLYEESEKKLEAIVSAGRFEGLVSSLEDDLHEDHVSVDSEKVRTQR
ncbi:hypothetical protein CASFOL_036382 [Castilleja foliolosa]|uniref:Uncharacterized protein n=1 Tax=Castilleja foliolosa TaxID=1961234 RepID=A0ABD3BVF6_9LAMI